MFISTRIKAMENRLLTRDRMERMLEAATNEEAAKVMVECGYPEMHRVSQDTLDAALMVERRRVVQDLSGSAPNPGVLDVFKVKYDYHNAKCIIKAEAMGTDAAKLLMDIGRVHAHFLMEAAQTGNFRGVPDRLRAAIAQGREVLGNTNDPQLADFVLDKACYADLFEIAHHTGSSFLEGYVRLSIDAVNLRTVVRALRMGKSADFLKGVLFEGGNLSASRIMNAVSTGNALEELYKTTVLRDAAAEGVSVLGGGGLIRFEKLCDDAVSGYLAHAKYVPFGEETVIGYLAAKETEYTAIRIIMTGRMAGLDGDIIRERLREAYA